jgi:hypothetical protein
MTAHAAFSQRPRRKSGGFLLTPLAIFAAILLAAASFVAYVLWPIWPSGPAALNAPALPVTVAGVLFEVPPDAIRAALQRHPGPHERIDLAFAWPSLKPPRFGIGSGDETLAAIEGEHRAANTRTPAAQSDGRVFVTITELGSVLPPTQRLREIYPHYAAATPVADRNGLAILPFRSDTPYAGQDLVYRADKPDRFFALCTRQAGLIPGTCISERAIEGADLSLRFPRKWLEKDWRSVAAGLDRLVAQIHPPSK